MAGWIGRAGDVLCKKVHGEVQRNQYKAAGGFEVGRRGSTSCRRGAPPAFPSPMCAYNSLLWDAATPLRRPVTSARTMSPSCNIADLRSNCYVPICFALWYALNVAYNITNKWALEEVRVVVEHRMHSHHASSALPFTIGCLQFGIGAVYACTLWMLGWRRPVPHADELSRAASYMRRWLVAARL